MFYQIQQPLLIVLSVALPVWIAARLIENSLYKERAKMVSGKLEVTRLIFLAYMISVLMITLFPVPRTRVDNTSLIALNYIPLRNTIRQFRFARSVNDVMPAWQFFKNFFGNVLMFMPLGVLLPLLWSRFTRLKPVVITAFLFSFGIEFSQYLSRYMGNYRSADVDDIILNTFGAALGFAIYYLFTPHKKH